MNVGQLVREQHSGKGVHIVGFGSYSGTVVAASQWEGQMKIMNVPAGLKGSWEAMMHSIEPLNKILFMDGLRDISRFNQPIGHRAIRGGVQSRPGAGELCTFHYDRTLRCLYLH